MESASGAPHVTNELDGSTWLSAISRIYPTVTPWSIFLLRNRVEVLLVLLVKIRR